MNTRGDGRTAVTVSLMLCLTVAAQLFASEPERAGGPLAPKHAFSMDRIEIFPILPFSPRGVKAVPKDGNTFVVVLFGPVTPNTPIEPKHLGATVFAGHETYTPLAFGFPLKNSRSPLLLIGRLTSGDIRIVGPKESFIGLIYELPKDVKSVQVQSATGISTTMNLDETYRVPDSSKISDLLSSGRLEQDKYRTEDKPPSDQ